MKKHKYIPSLTIAQRLVVGIVIIIGLVGTIAWYSAHTLGKINAANIERNRMTDARKTARTLDIDVLRIIIDLQYFVQQKDEASVRDIAANRLSAKQERTALRNLTSNPETIAKLDKYEAILPARVASANKIIAATRAGQTSAQISELLNERKTLDDEARGYLRDMINIEEASSEVALKNLSAEITAARTNLILCVIIVALIVIAISYYLYRSIITPLRELTDMAAKIKRGTLTASNTVKSKDEFGTLGRTMNDMAREIERVDDIKSHFISIASHQLRTPATAVKQNLGLIIEGIATKESDKSRFIHEAYESNEYQLAIIDDILNVARIESGHFKLTKDQTDLGKLVTSVIDEQRASVKKGQVIAFDAPHPTVTAQVDATKLKMCVGNLLSNAIKYTAEGGTITLAVAEDGGRVAIAITDTGVGIAKQDIPKLFAKFSRINNSLSNSVGGTGLGLYLVRELIRLHGGDVDVESVPGSGSTFIIKLPKE